MPLGEVSKTSVEYPSSALRYGLLELKPIPVKEVLRFGKIRLRKTGIKYTPVERIQSFEDYVRFAYESIFCDMPLPDRFAAEDLVVHFTDKVIKDFDEDVELQEELKELKETKSLLAYVDFIKNRYEDRMQRYYLVESSRFMKSNLPLSFFTRTAMFTNTYQKYLSLVRRIVRRYEIMAGLPGVRLRYQHVKREHSKMKATLSSLIDKMDLCVKACSSLKQYVCVWNSRDLDDISRPEFLDVKNLDPTYFEEYRLNYAAELKGMRRMIFMMSKEYDPGIFNKEVESGDSTTRMLSKLITCDLP